MSKWLKYTLIAAITVGGEIVMDYIRDISSK